MSENETEMKYDEVGDDRHFNVAGDRPGVFVVVPDEVDGNYTCVNILTHNELADISEFERATMRLWLTHALDLLADADNAARRNRLGYRRIPRTGRRMLEED